MDTDYFGDICHLQGLELADAMVKEIRLDIHYLLGNLLQRRLPLDNGRYQPLCIVELLLQVLLLLSSSCLRN